MTDKQTDLDALKPLEFDDLVAKTKKLLADIAHLELMHRAFQTFTPGLGWHSLTRHASQRYNIPAARKGEVVFYRTICPKADIVGVDVARVTAHTVEIKPRKHVVKGGEKG